jgi:hypothetical protein
MSRRLVALLAAGGVGLPAWAAEPAPMPRPAGQSADVTRSAAKPAAELDQELIGSIATRSQLMANLQHLSDVIGPRLTGSQALVRANNWAAKKMEGYGLENVRLEPWEIPVGWERGTATMRMVEPTSGRTIPVVSWAWNPGTKGKLTGPVIAVTPESRKDLLKQKGKLKGAVLLWGPPSPVAPITDLSYLGQRPAAKGDGPTPPKKDEPKADAPKADAKKEEPKRDRPAGFGGRFFLPPTPEELAFLTAEGAAVRVGQSSKPHGLFTMSGSWRGIDRTAANEGFGYVIATAEAYGMLWRLATTPDQKVTVETEVTNTFVPGPLVCFNTVGEICGSEKPDEYVVIGAHLDSWDLGSGTTDNGTGSCVVLECARALGELAKAGYRPKRTIRFALFSGEEQGLHGSREYVKRHEAELAKTSVVLVHDTGTGKVNGLGTHGQTKAMAVLGPELEALSAVGFKGLSASPVGGTDHQSFHPAGVLGFACQQDADEYRLTHHTQTDTFDKAKEPNLLQGAQVLSVTAYRAANLPDLLPKMADKFDRGRGRKEAPKGEKKEEQKEAEKKAG